MNTYYSQTGEDLYVNKKFINKKVSDGIFVELGAIDGITFSGSKFFEDTLGFSGVLIEPSAEYGNLVKNRSKCKCVNVAINSKEGPVKFIGNNSCAGIVELMVPELKNAWFPGEKEYYVQGDLFSNVLHKCDIKYIDFLSIDVQGGELEVLETMDFNIPVYVIVIELDGHNLEKDKKCRNILINRGFIYENRIDGNEFWYNDNYFRRDKLYENSGKCMFESIHELGNFPFIPKHDRVISSIENALK